MYLSYVILTLVFSSSPLVLYVREVSLSLGSKNAFCVGFAHFSISTYPGSY
jgi:hypothetical protein